MRRLAVLLGLVPVWGCATVPLATPASLAGCYYFERDAAATSLRLPWGVRLLADPVQGWPALEQRGDAWRAVTLVDATRTADHPFGYWRATADDAVEIGYPAGGGLLLELGVEPTRLVGTARAVGDLMPLGADPPRDVQRVSLTHAQCP